MFVMVIPPPNVTGTLHIGHTLMVAIEVRDCSSRSGRSSNNIFTPSSRSNVTFGQRLHAFAEQDSFKQCSLK